MGESLEDKLARLGDEAEAGEEDQTDRPLPAGVKVLQPNRAQARSRVLQVRLKDGEYEALEQLAAAQGDSVSAFARDELLESVKRAQAAAVLIGGTVSAVEQVAQLVASLEVATTRLRNQLVHAGPGPGVEFLGSQVGDASPEFPAGGDDRTAGFIR